MLPIASQTRFGQLQVALRNGDLILLLGNLIPESLNIPHLFYLRKFSETWWCLYRCFRHAWFE
jgi:hypothetical protein